MIAEITVDVTKKGAKKKKFKDVPFFFDPKTDVKFAYPIDDGKYIRMKVDGEIFDVNTTEELLDSLVAKFDTPNHPIGFQPVSLITKKKRTSKKKVRQE